MAIPINKQGGRATYYYPGDGYLRRYDDFGVTQISLEAWTCRQDAEKAFWGGSVRWVDDPTDPPLHPSIGLVQRPLARVINDDLLPMPAAKNHRDLWKVVSTARRTRPLGRGRSRIVSMTNGNF
jgi:hypothetical protein